MLRECQECFTCHRGLAIPTYIVAHAWPTWHSGSMRNPKFYVFGKRPMSPFEFSMHNIIYDAFFNLVNQMRPGIVFGIMVSTERHESPAFLLNVSTTLWWCPAVLSVPWVNTRLHILVELKVARAHHGGWYVRENIYQNVCYVIYFRCWFRGDYVIYGPHGVNCIL